MKSTVNLGNGHKISTGHAFGPIALRGVWKKLNNLSETNEFTIHWSIIYKESFNKIKI